VRDEQALRFLDRLQLHKIKLRLQAMDDFLGRLGSPHRELDVVHVAGTNGKGSVAALLEAVLHAHGRRVGVYASPHLSDVRERFRVGGRYMDRDTFARLVGRIARARGREPLTYFECTTALALLFFAEAQVDLAVLEVGMGGRLDATNVVRPLVAVITNIGLDHQEYLGDTLSAIAQHYRVSLASLRSLNRIAGDRIRVGQVLRIPGG